MPALPPRSLRRQLLIWLLPSVLVMLALSMLGDYMIAIRPATRAYDQSLRDNAALLKHHLVVDQQGNIRLLLTPEAELILLTEENDVNFYAIYDSKDRLISGTPGLLPPGTALHGNEGFFDVHPFKDDLRLYVKHTTFNGQAITIEAADTTHKRRALSQQIIIGMLLPELLTVLSVMVAVWISVGRGLAPLDRLQKLVKNQPQPAMKQLPEAQTPTELYGLVHIHNVQTEKLREALAIQEHFLTTAAHQLRTPLAGLQTQSDLALKLMAHQGIGGDLHKIVSNINAASRRCSRLVQQLLGLARSRTTADAFEACDLAQHAEAVANRFVDRAVAANIDLGLELEHAEVSGIGLLIEELIGNLLDNALRYCPDNSSVTIRTGMINGGARLVVEDNGPGVPDSQYQKIFERFHRLNGEVEGAGLGLAIVREIVDLHGATITAGAGSLGRGLTIEVRFPPRS